MKRLLDIVVAIFISLEMLLIAVLIGCFFMLHDELESLGSTIAASSSAIEWLSLLPACLLVYAISQYASLLFPDGPQARTFQHWPGYNMVKDRYVITLLLLFISTVVAIGFWITSLDFSNPAHFLWFFGSIGVSLVATANFFWARITLRRILATAAEAADGQHRPAQDGDV